MTRPHASDTHAISAKMPTVSPNTIACYRDAFRLLLSFLQQKTGTPPAKLQITDLDAPTIGAFLEHLENERGNSARTRNIRLAAA